MIKNISIKQYRKLKNICLNFSPYINLISGGNGTCKTSLLHMIGNAFQRVTASKAKLIDNRAINIMNFASLCTSNLLAPEFRIK